MKKTLLVSLCLGLAHVAFILQGQYINEQKASIWPDIAKSKTNRNF